MVLRYGMDEGLGPVSYADTTPGFLAGGNGMGASSQKMSPETARRIDDAVQGLLTTALEKSLAILRAHREVLDRCAAALMERETLDEPELLALAGQLHPTPPQAGPASGRASGAPVVLVE